jgi:hypothetical protein
MKNKIKEYFRRYIIPLTLATITAILSANIIFYFLKSYLLAGFIATWLDNFVFYGYIAIVDLKKRKFLRSSNKIKEFIKLIRNMLIEFGPAEYLDSFILRPLLLAIFPMFIANYSLGVLLGSLTAEISYFLFTIIGYEFRKKVFKD